MEHEIVIVESRRARKIKAAPYLEQLRRIGPFGLLSLVALAAAIHLSEPPFPHPRLVQLALLALALPLLVSLHFLVAYVVYRHVPTRWTLSRRGIQMRGASLGPARWRRVSRWILEDAPDGHFRLRVWEGEAAEAHQIVCGPPVSADDVRSFFCFYHQAVQETLHESRHGA